MLSAAFTRASGQLNRFHILASDRFKIHFRCCPSVLARFSYSISFRQALTEICVHLSSRVLHAQSHQVLQAYTASQPIRSDIHSLLPWELQISYSYCKFFIKVTSVFERIWKNFFTGLFLWYLQHPVWCWSHIIIFATYISGVWFD
jgi:hypothetical protein